MNSTVKAALTNGVFSAKNARIDAKGVCGWVSLSGFSVLSASELSALTDKFGAAVVALCGLKSNDTAADTMRTEKAAEAGTAQAAMAKLTGSFIDRGHDVDRGIRHGLGDD